jgi:FkbM family methyltransferase
MSKIARAREIYTEDGFLSLLNSFNNFIFNRLVYRYWIIDDKIKSTKYIDDITEVNDIKVCLDFDAFSSDMRIQIRNKGYETAEKEMIAKYIHNNHPCIDLGAGIGYTSCTIDTETSESSPTIAVEANESLISVIQDTRSRNSCDFEILHSAYHPVKESIKLQIAEDFWSSSQFERKDSEQSEFVVPAISVEQIINKYGLNNPIQIVCDIEGGEHNLITDEKDVLENISLIIFEYHSFTECEFEHYDNILTEVGFRLIESQGSVYVYKKRDYISS